MAFLRQIKIQGFKSFGTRPITLNLDKGFTAIVGENGSGKSNILDAVCFVLGRLSSRSLRAENFASLLFNGGMGRSPAKNCRITLVFDNRDRQFPVDTNELSISREVDTSGISAYRIGGKRCTRIELLDTIGVAGLQPEGHNIVMQNELANIITMSAAETREIVEGVAGISVFDEKKRQIETELDKVDKNLQAVQMRTEEISLEYERLKRDRQDALRWQEITERLTQLERDLTFTELARLEHKLNEMKAEHETSAQKMRDFETQRKKAKDRKVALEHASQTDGIRIKESDRLLHKNEIEATRFREQIRGLELTTENLKNQVESLTASLDHFQSLEAEEQNRNSQIKDEISEFETHVVSLQEKISPLRIKLAKFSKETSKPEADYLALRNEIMTITQTIELKQSEQGEISALLRVRDQKITDLQKQIEDSVTLLSEQENEVREAHSNHERLETDLERAEEELNQLEEQQQTIQQRILGQRQKQTELEQLIQTTKEELIEAQTRLKTIQEFKKHGFTYRAATQEVLKFAKEHKIAGVHGTLGSLGKTSTKHAVALEVAGGNRLNFIIVDDEETATKCIKYLKKSQTGRATFIPLSSIKANSEKFKAKEKGVVGNAIDLLSFDEKFRPAFEYAFGRTLIVNDLDIARNFHSPGYRKITIEGDVVESNRTMTGGYFKGLSSLTLEEETRIPELQKKLKELQSLQTNIDSEYRKWLKESDQFENQITEARNNVAGLQRRFDIAASKVAEKEDTFGVYKTSIERLRDVLKEEESAQTQLQTQQEQGETAVSQLTLKREKIQENLAELEQISLDPAMSRLRDQLDEFEDQLRKAQLQLTEKKGELRISLTDQKRVKKDIEHSTSELVRIQSELEKTNSEITSLQNNLMQTENELERITDEISTLEQQLETNESESRLLAEQIDEFFDKINEEKMYQSKQEARIEVWEDRVVAQKEKVEGMEPPAIPIDPFSVHSLRRQKTVLEQEREELGLINQKAVERFDEVRHAYDEILEKEQRIREEREAILDAMRRAEEEKFKVFMTAFTSISQNFSEVYEQLTHGEGQLELENPENPFLGGIRMKVRPAGKRVQYLDALSGGEKALTALTFIFALQLHQPAPFYFLDEIDEALDPNNADRVARLLENLSKDSQFIIVSHNEITIRFAHTLLGVAMVDGISRVFSVKFEEGLLLADGKSVDKKSLVDGKI